MRLPKAHHEVYGERQALILLPGKIFVCTYSRQGSRPNTKIQCVLVWLKHGKKQSRVAASLAAILRVRAGSDSSEADKQSQTLPHLAQKQIDSMAKSAAGGRGERCVQVCPTRSGPKQKQLDLRAGYVHARRSGGFMVAWTAEGTSEESKLQSPRPSWSRASRAPRSGGVQLSWAAELAQPSEKARKGS